MAKYNEITCSVYILLRVSCASRCPVVLLVLNYASPKERNCIQNKISSTTLCLYFKDNTLQPRELWYAITRITREASHLPPWKKNLIVSLVCAIEFFPPLSRARDQQVNQDQAQIKSFSLLFIPLPSRRPDSHSTPPSISPH